MSTPQSIQEQLQSLEPSAIIELFQLQLTAAVNGIDTTFYYHAGPIEVEGFEVTSKGTLPRPTMRVANANSAISALIVLYNPLQAKVTRIRTCKKFLDAVNFSGGNATADPTAKFEDEIWYIDRVANENPQAVEFELTSKLDLTNLALPRRQVLEHCPWQYRGAECGYTGRRYFDLNDRATNAANDQ